MAYGKKLVRRNPSVVTLINPAKKPAKKAKKVGKAKMAKKAVRRKSRKNPASGTPTTKSALKAYSRKPGISRPAHTPGPSEAHFVSDPWRATIAGVKAPGFYYRKSATTKRGLRSGSWAYYKNPTKKRRTRRVRKNAKKASRKASCRRNPSRRRRVARRPTRVVYMNPIRRRRRRSVKRANPRKRSYRRGSKRSSIRRNPASILMYLGVAAGSVILSRVAGRMVESKLNPSLPESIQPYSKLLTQGLLAAGAIGIYMGKLKVTALKPHSAAMAAGFTAAFLDSVVQKWAPENVKAYIGAGETVVPAVAPTTGGAAGFGRVDVYEAALRGLGQTGASTNIMSLRDYVARPRGLQDYVSRPAMADYVSRPAMAGVGSSTDILALSDFNANYKRWA